ncbi:hypothetical protein OEB99_19245 [Actinotalea sp. M2MS4P-6]|uniref:hypothetical protein n=1 Tax=Actinotalea sp. M2MS4P-6 TaxID=2983762 RepID=UPI0021E3A1FA|nr:hypothetical protein [Actinotalea sp. M2MS4P-6]MCV2396452.1 hypothetical protein [Actinotalea sp. M2MS4P-6]
MRRLGCAAATGLVLAVSLAGCASGDVTPAEASPTTSASGAVTETASPTTPATPSTTVAPTASTTATTSATAAILADGDHTGFVRGYDGTTIEFDPAPILTGADALAAAQADGVDVSEGLPNDFYIPLGAGVVQLETSPDLTIALLDNTDISVTHDVDAATFQAFLAGDAPDWAIGSPDALFATLRVSNGVVVAVRQFYLP